MRIRQRHRVALYVFMFLELWLGYKCESPECLEFCLNAPLPHTSDAKQQKALELHEMPLGIWALAVIQLARL